MSKIKGLKVLGNLQLLLKVACNVLRKLKKILFPFWNSSFLISSINLSRSGSVRN